MLYCLVKKCSVKNENSKTENSKKETKNTIESWIEKYRKKCVRRNADNK